MTMHAWFLTLWVLYHFTFGVTRETGKGQHTAHERVESRDDRVAIKVETRDPARAACRELARGSHVSRAAWCVELHMTRD